MKNKEHLPIKGAIMPKEQRIIVRGVGLELLIDIKWDLKLGVFYD